MILKSDDCCEEKLNKVKDYWVGRMVNVWIRVMLIFMGWKEVKD